jgi:hypothetical protein
MGNLPISLGPRCEWKRYTGIRDKVRVSLNGKFQAEGKLVMIRNGFAYIDTGVLPLERFALGSWVEGTMARGKLVGYFFELVRGSTR